MWIQLLHNEYQHFKTSAQVTAQPNYSPFWGGLIRTKVAFLGKSRFIIENGLTPRCWEDTRLGETPRALEYPTIYNIVQRNTHL